MDAITRSFLLMGGCAFLVLIFIFWIWILVDCATKELDTGNTKLVWIIIVVFTYVVGAAIYFFVRRPRRIAELGR
jgi:predicted membrane channel-forming protein YqfA (hemolysin III family)